MSLSPIVLTELQNLQFYFRKLYFLRFFIPSAIKTQLRALEIVQIDTAHEQEVIAQLGLLCAAFIKPNWYTRVILYLFSGLRLFNRGNLMKHVRELESQGDFSQANIAWLVQQEPLSLGVQCLSILSMIAITPPDRKYERLNQIGKIMHLALEPNVKVNFYKIIAAQTGPLINYAAAIQLLKTDPRSEQYIKTLLDAQNVSEYASALVLLTENNLLPALASDIGVLPAELEHDELKLLKYIVSIMPLHAHPLALTTAVLELEQNKQLDAATFEQIHASDAPEDLARLINEFNHPSDPNVLSRLEQHRKNLAVILQSNAWILTPEQRLDLEYCQTLRSIVDASTTDVSAGLHALYDGYYAALEVGDRADLIRELAAFSSTDACDSPCGPLYSRFLLQHITSQHKWTYMKLCTWSATKLKSSTTPDNIVSIFEMFVACVRPNELLARLQCHTSEDLSIDYVRAVFFAVNTPKNSKYQQKNTLNRPQEGLHQRHATQVRTVKPLAQEGDDLEAGLPTAVSRLNRTPQDPQASSTWMRTMAWFWPASKANKRDDEDPTTQLDNVGSAL